MALSMSPMRLYRRQAVVRQTATRHKNPHTKETPYQTSHTTSGKREQKLWSQKSLQSNLSWPFIHCVALGQALTFSEPHPSDAKYKVSFLLNYCEGEWLYSKSLLSQCWPLWFLNSHLVQNFKNRKLTLLSLTLTLYPKSICISL